MYDTADLKKCSNDSLEILHVCVVHINYQQVIQIYLERYRRPVTNELDAGLSNSTEERRD